MSRLDIVLFYSSSHLLAFYCMFDLNFILQFYCFTFNFILHFGCHNLFRQKHHLPHSSYSWHKRFIYFIVCVAPIVPVAILPVAFNIIISIGCRHHQQNTVQRNNYFSLKIFAKRTQRDVQFNIFLLYCFLFFFILSEVVVFLLAHYFYINN